MILCDLVAIDQNLYIIRLSTEEFKIQEILFKIDLNLILGIYGRKSWTDEH